MRTRFFKCHFISKDEMVVRVETDRTDDISSDVVVSDELGDAEFGHERYGRMLFEECEELTEEQALQEIWMYDNPTIEHLPLAEVDEQTWAIRSMASGNFFGGVDWTEEVGFAEQYLSKEEAEQYAIKNKLKMFEIVPY